MIVAAVVFGLMAVSVFGANHDQIIGVFVKVKNGICQTDFRQLENRSFS